MRLVRDFGAITVCAFNNRPQIGQLLYLSLTSRHNWILTIMLLPVT